MTIWPILIIGGIVTYACRISFIAFGDRIRLPGVAERALDYVAPAAFAAISIPLVLGGDGFADFTADIPRIVAALVTALIVWRTRSLPLSLLGAMSTLWLLTWLM